MLEIQPTFDERTRYAPRHPQQEIVDLLAVALLRLRVASARLNDDRITGAEYVVAMSGYQSVNAANRSNAGDSP